jgi:hypothetical protein
MFENVSGVIALHPDFRKPADAGFCVPVIKTGDHLDQVRAELNARASKLSRKEMLVKTMR